MKQLDTSHGNVKLQVTRTSWWHGWAWWILNVVFRNRYKETWHLCNLSQRTACLSLWESLTLKSHFWSFLACQHWFQAYLTLHELSFLRSEVRWSFKVQHRFSFFLLILFFVFHLKRKKTITLLNNQPTPRQVCAYFGQQSCGKKWVSNDLPETHILHFKTNNQGSALQQNRWPPFLVVCFLVQRMRGVRSAFEALLIARGRTGSSENLPWGLLGTQAGVGRVSGL